MRVNFRQGIISYQSGGFLKFNGLGNVDIMANTRPVTVTVAEKDSDYTFTEDNNFTNAWLGPFDIDQAYWLYWEFDTQTFARTFNKTTLEPIAAPTQPSSPEADQLWFDTTNNVMYRHSGLGWLKIIGLVAAKAINSTLAAYSINAPSSYAGTQIGDTTTIRSGRPLFNSAGRCIKKPDNTFYTTEDDIYINDSQSAAIRLESNIVRGKSTEAAIAEFSIVAFSDAGEIRTAQYADSESTITAILMESLIQNQVGVVVPQGVVTNPGWEWTQPVGTAMWIDNGQLTSVDPYVTNRVLNPYPKTPVARIIATDTVLFEQGLGGVGPKGPQGSVSGQIPSTTTSLGAVVLSTPPAIPGAPVVVSTTDPRVAGGPFSPTTHTHTAANIAFVPSGVITASNVQAAILQTIDGNVRRDGDTMTGTLVLNGPPVDPLDAATKQFVEDSTSGFATTEHTHTASEIALIPSGDITSDNVQAGIIEMGNAKYDKTGGTISGDVEVTGISDFAGISTFSSGLTSDGEVNVNNILNVTGIGAFSSDLSIGGNAQLDADLNVDGNATFHTITLTNNLIVGGYLTVAEYIDVVGNHTIGGALAVTGDTTLSGTLDVAGVVTIANEPEEDNEVATKKYVDDQTANSGMTELPYDLTFYIAGPAATVAGGTVGVIVVPRTITINPNVENVFGRALTPPAETVVYEIYKGVSVVGTITFDPAVDGGLVPAYQFASVVTITAGTYLEVKPTTYDTEIANVAVTIVGSSTDLTSP